VYVVHTVSLPVTKHCFYGSLDWFGSMHTFVTLLQLWLRPFYDMSFSW